MVRNRQSFLTKRDHSILFATFLIFSIFCILISGHMPLAKSQLNNGDILVVDFGAGTNGDGQLYRVDPVTGQRTIVSNFGDGAQGPLGVDPRGVAVEASGQVLVVDYTAGTSSRGELFRVDPTTGARTVLSDFGVGAQGPLGVDPRGVAVEASGQVLVVDRFAGTGERGQLYRVDPVTGARTVLSDFGLVGQGPRGADPNGVAVEASGQVLVIDSHATPGTMEGQLFRVDPTTGARTVLSDFGVRAQGPKGWLPCGVAVVLPPSAAATAQATDSTGRIRDSFISRESVYAIGSNFLPGASVDIYVVNDHPWSNFMTIPADVSSDGMNTATADPSGNIGPVNIWPAPTAIGAYDIVIDVNQNGRFDLGIDAVDHPNHPGFIVASLDTGSVAVGGYYTHVDSFAVLFPYLVLVGLVCIISTILIKEKKRKF